jgi:O-antigen/teichoic acid export membrane protein
LKPVKHFATGAALTAIAGVPLLMTAPILLSGTVPLSEYGFYTIATIYAGVIAMLYMPIFTAIYPRLTALVESRDAQVAMNFYKFSSQFMALMVIPIGFALAIYAFPLIYFWQRDIARATAIAPIAAIYVFGYILSGLNHIPLALQFAHGNTKLNLTLTVILGLLQIPLLILAIRTNGVTGAAYIFLMINVLLIILSVTLTNKVVIHFGALKWLTSNVLIPFFVAGLVFLVSALVTSTPVPNFINTIVTLSVTTLAAFFFTTTSLSMIRSWLSTKFL